MIELVEKAKAGNENAFVELFDTVKVQLYKTALVRLCNEQDALDAIQESLVKAFSNIKNLRENKFFKTWLIRILINECNNIEAYRKKVILKDNALDNNSHQDEQDLSMSMDIRVLTSKLDTIYKEVIDLRYNHDLKLEDIAIILDIPLGTVKSRLNKAHKLLKEQLETSFPNKEVSYEL